MFAPWPIFDTSDPASTVAGTVSSWIESPSCIRPEIGSSKMMRPVTNAASGWAANAAERAVTQSGAGTQSSSVKATTGVEAALMPMLRARQAPGWSQRRTVAPDASATARTRGSREAESTTTRRSSLPSDGPMAARASAKSTGRSRVATTTVTAGAPPLEVVVGMAARRGA